MTENTVKQRLIWFIKHKSLSQKKFEELLGLSNGYVNNIRKGISDSVLFKICSQFPDLNRDWLLYGEGEMLKEKQENKTENRGRLIPFYDVETTGGYQGEVASSTNEAELIGYIQPGGWFDGKETAAIRHVGDSMIEYPNGCVLAVREVTDRHLLVPGRNYVIETSEYRVTKRVQRGSRKGVIALYSTNQEKYDDGHLVYEPFEVSFGDIQRIFSVLGFVVNQAGEFHIIKS